MSAASQKWNDAVWFFTGVVTAIVLYIVLSGEPKKLIHDWQELLSLVATLFAGVLAYIGIQRQISQQYDAEKKRQSGLASYMRIAAKQYAYNLSNLASEITNRSNEEQQDDIEFFGKNKNILWPPHDFSKRISIPLSLQLKPEEFAHMSNINIDFYMRMNESVLSLQMSKKNLEADYEKVEAEQLQDLVRDMIERLQDLIRICHNFEDTVTNE